MIAAIIRGAVDNNEEENEDDNNNKSSDNDEDDRESGSDGESCPASDEKDAPLGEYHSEREYFSDPDYHDERPGKTTISSSSSSSTAPDDGMTSMRDNENSVQQDDDGHSEQDLDNDDDDDNGEEEEDQQEESTTHYTDIRSTIDEENSSNCTDNKSSIDEEELTDISDSISTVEEREGDVEDDESSDQGSVFTVKPANVTDASIRLKVEHNEEEYIREGDFVKDELKRKMLVDLVSEYCDKLVDIIKEEALRQVELITSANKVNPISQLSINHKLESSALNYDSDIYEKEFSKARQYKRIYTSSLFYDDRRNSFPTIEQQIEKSRTIAKQLESCPEEDEEEDQKVIGEDEIQDHEYDHDQVGAKTDTEYEAPRVKIHRKSLQKAQSQVDLTPNRSYPSKFQPHYKPFLDSTVLKDIERLREWSPRQDFNEHSSVSPEVCLKLVEDLTSSTNKHDVDGTTTPTPNAISRGAQLFERIQSESAKWVVEATQTPSEPLEETEISTADPSQRDDRSNLNLPRVGEREPLMVAHETEGEQQVLEFAPVPMKHSSPHLETATISRTPSFQASSRRVIECDSPDLLTSHDDDDGDDGEEEPGEDEYQPRTDGTRTPDSKLASSPSSCETIVVSSTQNLRRYQVNQSAKLESILESSPGDELDVGVRPEFTTHTAKHHLSSARLTPIQLYRSNLVHLKPKYLVERNTKEGKFHQPNSTSACTLE